MILMKNTCLADTGISRRNLIKSVGLGTAGTALANLPTAIQAKPAIDPKWRVKNGRIKQSIMGWCFKPMPAEELARHCKDIGLVAMEGIDRKAYPYVKKLGLKISLVGSHSFKTGPFSRDNHDMVKSKLLEAIDVAADIGTKNVITFTGMREKGITDEQGARNCVEAWKSVIGYAEKKGITLAMEHLNSRDNTHPMKGHPGYFGDDVDFCVKLIERVGSPNMKLLFDIYHVQMMNGDVIRRIRQYKDVIGHYHTAGNPGRGELDDTQEINYPPIMKAILETGYKGFVAQEFIPTWDDPVAALRHAASVCDV